MVLFDRYGGAAGALCNALSGDDFAGRLGERLTAHFGRATLPLCSTDAALHTALRLCGVASGDYVLVPSYTYYSYIRSALNIGAVPVFIDSDPINRCTSVSALETALVWCRVQEKMPRVAIIDNAFGAVADYDTLLPLLASFGVPAIEIACDALGGSYKGTPCGANCELGVVGLNKRIPGSGAALVCGDDLGRAEEFSRLRYSDGENYDYGMSNYIAALNLELFDSLEATVSRAQKNYAALAESFECVLPPTAGDAAAYAPIKTDVEEQDGFTIKKIQPTHKLPLFSGAHFFEHEQGFCAADKLAEYALVGMDFSFFKRLKLSRLLKREG
ncbi:MAG: DegT/DnrJ/EryC1/StrS family aminotransferase [Clostridiales bacterium]|nr:DegT/DnrJ/EryC1/StrS family aminotransferase [Clostridiales bacterium]